LSRFSKAFSWKVDLTCFEADTPQNDGSLSSIGKGLQIVNQLQNADGNDNASLNLNLLPSFFNPKREFVSLLLMCLGLQLLVADYQWESGPGFRRAKLLPAGAGKEGFTLLPPEQTGIFFTNAMSEQRTLSSEVLPSGSGVAAGDVDGDGLCDLYFCSLKSGNHLYRNLGGVRGHHSEGRRWLHEPRCHWRGARGY
jgi:hypothetical protein